MKCILAVQRYKIFLSHITKQFLRRNILLWVASLKDFGSFFKVKVNEISKKVFCSKPFIIPTKVHT